MVAPDLSTRFWRSVVTQKPTRLVGIGTFPSTDIPNVVAGNFFNIIQIPLKVCWSGIVAFLSVNINSYRTEYISVSDNSQLNQEKPKYPKPKPRILGH